MEYLLLIFGFILLIKGADFFVEGSSSIARNLKIPSIIIGLTLVSMGTSAPEAAVSITAGLAGNSDLSLGNVIGSNMFNILMVIGFASLLRPIPTLKDIMKRDLPVILLCTTALLLLMLDGNISRLDGLLLLVGIVVYMIILVRGAMKNRLEETPGEVLPVPLSLVYVIGGLAAVVFGGQLVVDNASIIARNFGMSDTLVGLTIVAIGTSLPELVTSLMAAHKGDSGIALGNAIGSCIFNVLFILGIASVLSPIHVDMNLLIDVGLLIIITVILYLFAKTEDIISRKEGLACIVGYVLYSTFIIMR